MTDLDAIRERHRQVRAGMSGFCELDRQSWPCDAAQALARVAELEAALRQLDTEWVNGNVSTLAYERIQALARPEPKP
jgi:ribonuclease HI